MSVPGCGEDCSAPDWTTQEIVGPYKWCSFPVELPHNKWPEIGDKFRKDLTDNKTIAALQEIQLWLVEEPQDIQPALDALYASMKERSSSHLPQDICVLTNISQHNSRRDNIPIAGINGNIPLENPDPIIGIDTEWKPDSRQGENDVALISLASSSCVVLIRTCSLDRHGVWGVPKAVKDFCRDDEIVGVGFAWDLSDEKKLQSSFAVGRHDLFSHFVDVKTLSEMLGYYDTSVTTLAKRVLGFEPPKSPQVTVSNWEAAQLDGRQVRYAALDSLIPGDIFRTLRFYHHHQMECTGCSVPLGVWPGDLDLHCAAPECARKKAFATVSALMAHARSTEHDTYTSRCKSCYRVTGPTVDDYQAGQRQKEREETPVVGKKKKANKKSSVAQPQPQAQLLPNSPPVPYSDTDSEFEYAAKPQPQPQNQCQIEPQNERDEGDFSLEGLLELTLIKGNPSEPSDSVSQKQLVTQGQVANREKPLYLPSRRKREDQKHST